MLQQLIQYASNKQLSGVFILLVLIPIKSFSQNTFSFLNIPAHARLAALGGVNVTLSDRDVNMASSNPALNSDTLAGFASLSYQAYLAGISQTNAVFQPSFKKIRSFTIGVQHMNYGSIMRYDAAGAELGKANSGETALMFAKQLQSGNFRLGANLKTLFSNLAGYQSAAVAFDLGGIFTHPNQRMTVGLVIKNAGFMLSEYTETSRTKLPFDVQAGTTFKPEHMPFRFSLTAFDLTHFSVPIPDETDKLSTVDKVMRHVNVGAEMLLGKHVNVLFGYNFRNRQDLKQQQRSGAAGASIGFSVKMKTFELSMSRSSYGPKQPAYVFTLSVNTRDIIRRRDI